MPRPRVILARCWLGARGRADMEAMRSYRRICHPARVVLMDQDGNELP